MNAMIAGLCGFVIGAMAAALLLGAYFRRRSTSDHDVNETRLKSAFQALSGEALQSNHRVFVELAKSTLEGVLKETKGEILEKTAAIKDVVRPLEAALGRYEQHLSELEKSRMSDVGALKSQMETLASTHLTLQKETNNLVTALRRPEVRGRLGEINLRKTVEMAGLSSRCTFSEQVSVEGEDGRLRPDLVVNLPGERQIVVDSKVAFDAYLEAVQSGSDESKREHLIRHAQHVRKHMRSLASKNYWDQFEKAPDFVVMFMPFESLLDTAVEKDPLLIEESIQNKVILATPTTLIALLHAVAYGWRQEEVTKHAQLISDTAQDLYRRFEPFVEHVNATGNHLARAVQAFNKMTGSLERKILTGVRKFKDYGVPVDSDLEISDEIQETPKLVEPIEKN